MTMYNIEKLQNDKIVFTGCIVLCLEHLDTLIQAVTYIKKAITIKYHAMWTKDFTSSPPRLTQGGEEGTGQLEYRNTIASTF